MSPSVPAPPPRTAVLHRSPALPPPRRAARPTRSPPIAAHQPYLHRARITVAAPAFCVGDDDGAVRAAGVNGVYVADRRVCSELLVLLAGEEPVTVGTGSPDAATLRTTAVAPTLGVDGPDPVVTVDRDRVVTADGLTETLVVRNRGRHRVTTRLEVVLACDLADVADVKGGKQSTPLAASATGSGLRWTHPDRTGVVADLAPAPAAVDAAAGRLGWDVDLEAGAAYDVRVRLHVADDPTPQVVLAPATRAIGVPTAEAPDPRLGRLLERSVGDLAGLLLADPEAPDDRFFAAGAPWYLTLFGRDSLIAAHFALLAAPDVAAGTLRTLARRQGRRTDVESAEEPGKILHEIRRAATVHDGGTARTEGMALPPVYFGTVDASALWALLLHDAWRAGLEPAAVEPLLPALEGALGWMRDFGTDERGFVSYLDRSGHGLANQGWKDSHDSVQYADGRLAEGPIALCEVQGYAVAAARRGADLMDAFGRPGAAAWRSWADALTERFRATFWTGDDQGRFPGIAVAADGSVVDTLTSNVGHLLGTGILDRDESAAVVARLAAPDMSSGYGLRTMSARAAGFNPLSYHGGSVWTHDTAYVVRALGTAAAEGIPGAAEAAASLVDGLLHAATDFEQRLPELYGGQTREPGGRAAAYPASCRPQAWAAASAVVLAQTLAGVVPDVPNAVVHVRPLAVQPAGALTLRGLHVGGGTLDLAIDATGVPTVLAAPPGLQVLTP